MLDGFWSLLGLEVWFCVSTAWFYTPSQLLLASTGQDKIQRSGQPMRLEIYLRMDVTSTMEIIFRAWVRSDMLHVIAWY